MLDNNVTGECLIAEFAEKYMEKLFYFCLKKTSNNDDAEDLTQDIALNIVTALNKGTIPTSFSAWIWQIARNRYSVWADDKHKRNESVTGSDIGDYEIEDEGENALEEMINSEQLSLLRRELAFIKNDYRDIIVAYYIESHSIRDIAAKLSLTSDAVKKRLQRARTILKEGMNMAREFGLRSYNPEEIKFAASGSLAGRPWSLVQRKIPKNILLQASNNPSSVEELSVELGIARPYMEEEVQVLHEATLLEKCGDKYITNFFILNKECRLDTYNILRSGSKERSRCIHGFISDSIKEIRAMGIAGDHLDDNVVRWWLVPSTIDILIDESFVGKDYLKQSKRSNGEDWGFVGYEVVDLPEKLSVGHNGNGNSKNMFWAYKFGDYNMWNQCGEIGSEGAWLLGDSIRTARNISSFTKREEELWKKINVKYAHSDKIGRVIADIIVLDPEKKSKLLYMLKNNANYELLMQNVNDAHDRIREVFKKCNHRVLHDNMGYNILMEMYSMRMMAVHDLVDNGFLKLPSNPNKSTLGMHIELN